MTSISQSPDPHIAIPIVAGIGNAIMAVPMVRQIARALPEAHVTILARTPAMAEVFQCLPEKLDVRILGSKAPAMFRAMRQLRGQHPDNFLIPFPSNRWQYVLLAMASGARRRILHRYPIGQFRAWGFVPAERINAIRGLHDVIQNLQLLPHVGLRPDLNEAPRFFISPEDHQRGNEILLKSGADVQAPLVAVHPGSARTILARAKRWPPEQYAGLISQLQSRDLHPIILEGPDEIGVGNEIVRVISGAGPPVVQLNGPLADAAAVLQRCILYVGSDSGLGHLAAAVQTPPVTLFAPADPERVCPFGYRHLVVQPLNRACSPCFLYPWSSTCPKMKCTEPMCINEIPVELVLAAVDRALTQRPPKTWVI